MDTHCTWKGRNGVIIFTANEGNMSASNMAPVDNVLQDLIPVWFVVVIVPFVGCIPGSFIYSWNETKENEKRKKKKKKKKKE